MSSFNSVKKGDNLLLNGHPCSICEINRSSPGKHGHAKFSIKGKNLITGKIVDVKYSSHDAPHLITVKRLSYYCDYFDDDYAHVIDDSDKEHFFKVTNKKLLEKAQEEFEDGCDITILHITYQYDNDDHEHYIVTDLKEPSMN
jgi:translation initiation factor 5A